MHPNTLLQKETDARTQRDLLFEISADLLCIAGYDGILKQINPAWTHCLGWTEQELLSQPVINFVHPDDRELTLSARQTLTKGQDLKNFENRYLCKDGSFRWLSWSSLPYPASSSVFCIARDITQSKEVEQHLLRINRIESVGVLSAGIAHHLNNALTPISMTLDYLHAKERDQAHRKMISVSQESLHRGIQLIQRLVKFSKPQPLQSGQIHVPALLKGLMELLSENVPDSIQIEQQLHEPLPVLVADANILQQVFVDLILNAIEAMPHGGKIHISVSSVLREHPEKSIFHQNSSEHFVLFEIKDNGVGISETDLPRIFEPFYTTKKHGLGTGLGLSTANTAIQNHGGFLTIASQIDAGSTVEIYLPVTPPL
ncbi:ATP-binding protein [Kiritimatiellota bacterium B12222]|nr:ATP-binding protein [Kiritimatiellota bacterium B12222]